MDVTLTPSMLYEIHDLIAVKEKKKIHDLSSNSTVTIHLLYYLLNLFIKYY